MNSPSELVANHAEKPLTTSALPAEPGKADRFTICTMNENGKIITKIPVPGGSGKIRTGAMQFQDDWPGLFIRGDDAAMISIHIDQVEKELKEAGSSLPYTLSQVRDLIVSHVMGVGDLNWRSDENL